MAFVVVYDACVLYPAHLRDLLIRVAEAGLVQAKWTEEILDETFRSIQKNNPDLDTGRLERTRELMNAAIPDCLVENYDGLADGIELPDEDDRHVLAAAVRSGAQVIVTVNTKDSPETALGPLGIETQEPDMFIRHLIDLTPGRIQEVIQEQAADLINPPMSTEELLNLLLNRGLVLSVAEIKTRLGF